MLKVSLEQWRMFRAVVEFGGFNQAAQGIFKSQSSIHTAVSKIEDSLGVKLFMIQGRKTKLTDAGVMMLRRANFLLEEAEKVEIVGQTLAQGIESQLRIAVDEIFPQELLYKVLQTTSEQYPLLRIELIESVLSGANQLLCEANVDIAISGLPDSRGISEQLCQIDFIAVAHPEHALHKLERELQLEDLKGHRQIVVRDSSTTTSLDAGWLGANQRWTVSHLRTSIDIICNGLGFAWLPVNAINQQLQSGQLKPLPLNSGRNRTAILYLMFTDGDRLGPAANAFIDELRQQV